MKIEITNLSKNFKDVNILNDVNVTFLPNHIYGLSGKNGSGKTVFLKLLCGFYYPTTGEIKYNGNVLDSRFSYLPNTRVLIENPDFIPDLTGFENLKLLADIEKKITDEDILKAMDIVNIKTEKNKKFGKYSLGMKQKLGLAEVIMENPDIMIFDEPLNGIDDETAKKFRDFLREEKQKNKIIIIASHIKEDLNYLCDTVYRFNDGKLLIENEK
uniref:ABC transporter ATP-binding protein n=1 Tax=Candidatus Ventrenecus sp. TaxID=3085654 RepID=UPI003FF0CEA8